MKNQSDENTVKSVEGCDCESCRIKYEASDSKYEFSGVNNLIELWKTNCGNSRAVKPIVKELENEGITFEKYNIFTVEGKKVWDSYAKEIDYNSKKRGYELGYIYTPTFINPVTKKVLAIANNYPTKKQIIQLAQDTK